MARASAGVLSAIDHDLPINYDIPDAFRILKGFLVSGSVHDLLLIKDDYVRKSVGPQ